MNKAELIEAAAKVYSKAELNKFTAAVNNRDVKTAGTMIGTSLKEATESVLDTVYKDECDFVLMSHYRHCKDLFHLVVNGAE